MTLRVGEPRCARSRPSCCGRPSRLAAARGRRVADVHRRHRRRRHPLPHNSGAFGKKYLPETMGSGVRVPRRRRRRLAGHPARELDELAGPARAAQSLPALYRNNRDGTFTDITRAVRARRRDVRHRRGRRRLRQRRRRRPLRHRARRQPPVQEPRRRQVRGRHARRPASAIRASRRARCGSTTTATASSICSSRNYVEWSVEKDLFCTLDGKSKSYCTPESYKGQSPTLFRNRGDGTFEDVTPKAGLFDPDVEGARRGAARLRRRRLARPVRRQRHAAEPALPQQGRRHVRRRRRWRPASPSARRAWRAPAWASTPPTTTAPAGRACVIGNFSNEMMALYHNEGNGLFIDEAPTSTIGQAVAADADVRAASSSTTTSTAGSTSSPPTATSPTTSRACSRSVTYAQPPHLFRNLGSKKFEDVIDARRRGASAQPMVGARRGLRRLRRRRRSRPASSPRTTARRGCSATTAATGTTALRVQARSARRRIATASARAVASRSPAARAPWQMVKTGSSYCSQSELPLTFGLGTGNERHGHRGPLAEREDRARRTHQRRPVDHDRGRTRIDT